MRSSVACRSTSNQSLDIEPTKVKKVLQECYFIISDLKLRIKMLEDSVEQKNVIIDRLIKEKQEQLANISHFQNQNLKKQVHMMAKRGEQMKTNFQAIADNYEKIVKKYQTDIDKLKGFNKVLRIENNHLRNAALYETNNWRHRQNKIGKITQSKCNKRYKGQNKFQFTINRSDSPFPQEQVTTRLEANTPQKFDTSKSANLSTAARSNSHQHSKELSLKRQSIPKNLFNNSRLNEQMILISQPERLISEDKDVISFKEQTIGTWFSRLKKLLDESDQES